MDNTQDKSVFHSLTTTSSLHVKLLFMSIFVVAIGIVAGYLLVSMQAAKSSMQSAGTATSASSIQKGTVYGSDDTATFKDTAQGTVATGGIDGEGQFHLVRPGGDSQNVYMTSSLVDLSLFVNKQVKVWGQTQKAHTAGWLMDVGRVEVLQ